MQTCFLSIVIPVYNASKTVVRCLDSIWSQKLPEDEYEVICVDDCSADNSISVVEAVQKSHRNLALVRHEINRHAGGARNTGVRNAAGEYILFIDSDDYFHPGSLLKAFEYLKSNSDLDILTCNIARELPSATVDRLFHRYASAEKMSFKQYIALNHIPYSPWQWFFRRKLMTENQLWFREHVMCEDVDWTHHLILYAGKIQYQPILLTHYVIDMNTQTALSYARPLNVYSYMLAGKALYALRGKYLEAGFEEYLLALSKSNICQSLKYYFAMYDKVNIKKAQILEQIPADLSLSFPWSFFISFPLFFSWITNTVSPLVRALLKYRAKRVFRGIPLK